MKCKKNINLKGLALRIVALGQVVFTLATLGSCKKTNKGIVENDVAIYSYEVSTQIEDTSEYRVYNYLTKSLEEFFPDIEEADNEQKVKIADKYYSFFRGKNLYNEHDLLNATNAEIKQVVENSKNNYSCDYIYYPGNWLDLYNMIIEKSAKYEKDNYSDNSISVFVPICDGLELNESQIMMSNIIKDIIKKWDTYACNDKNEDACRFSDLKISIVKEYEEPDVFGYYLNDENLIVLVYNNILNLSNDLLFKLDHNNASFSEIIESTLEHEINHMRQHPCKCRVKKGQQCTLAKSSYSEIGSLLVESSAESALYNENLDNGYFYTFGSDGCSYNVERKAESELMLLSIFNSYSIDDYYKAVFDCDLSQILAFFGVESLDDIKDFYTILKQIDAIHFQNDLVYRILDTKKVTYEMVKDCVGSSYRVLLFDNVLKELINYTKNNNDFSLIENILIYNIIKTRIINKADMVLFDDNDECYYDKEIIDSIKESNDKYVQFLSQYYKVDINSINNYLKSSEFKEMMLVIKKILPRSNVSFSNIKMTKEEQERYDFVLSLLKKLPKLQRIMRYTSYWDCETIDLDDDSLLYKEGNSFTKSKKH